MGLTTVQRYTALPVIQTRCYMADYNDSGCMLLVSSYETY